MATAEVVLCSVCEGQSINKPSLKWCPECDEAFCCECIKHHSIAKATRDHAVISVEHYKKLPASVLQIKQYCPTHGSKYQNYCRSHAVPCCKVCINREHKKCHELPALDDVIRDAKSSVALDEIETRLRTLNEFVRSIIKERESNINKIKSDRTHIEQEVKKMKAKIIEHLNALESEVLKELSDAENKVENQIVTSLKELMVKSEKTEQLIENVIVMKKYASDLQVFLGTNELEIEVTNEYRYIEDLTRDINRISLSFSPEQIVLEFKGDVKCIGHIQTRTEQSEINMHRLEEKQAQIPAETSQDVSDINIELERTIVVPRIKNQLETCIVYGCLYLSDQSQIFSYTHSGSGCISLVNRYGRLCWKQSKDNLGCRPYDVTCIDDKTVAVTCNKPMILLINIDDGSIQTTIKTKHRCYGITCLDHKLLYSYGVQGLEMQCLKTGQVTSLQIGSYQRNEYVTVYRDNVYSTNSLDHSVTCYDPKGRIIWTWRNKEIIRGVHGVTVDGQGNVYVAGMETGNIVSISSDGKKFKSLIPGVIRNPRTINYNKQSKTLLVCENVGDAGIYTVH